ncbi:MAG: ferritin family protein [Candidatus Omnitrophica bacterium]|jgi:rubrerythrin|nr:ferritin family protein [Candidatus Omnitrophota bacterium]
MSNIYSPQEILRIAIKIEENGKKLYEALEKKTDNAAMREVWGYLKDQEEVHRKTFQVILDNVGDYIVYEFSPGEYDAYIKAIAAGYIFIQELIEKKTKEGFKSDLEAIDFGIYIEKESILTYSALRGYILTEKHPVLDKVIDEEKNHLVKLTLLKDKIKK